MSLGLLSKSHRLIRDQPRCVQQMQKALQQINVKLDSVLSDISGKSGMTIIEAVVAGELDARVLVRLCGRRVKRSESEIAAALLGNWREENLFALQQALESYQYYSGQLQQLEVRILSRVELLAVQITDDDSAMVAAVRIGNQLEASRTMMAAAPADDPVESVWSGPDGDSRGGSGDGAGAAN